MVIASKPSTLTRGFFGSFAGFSYPHSILSIGKSLGLHGIVLAMIFKNSSKSSSSAKNAGPFLMIGLVDFLPALDDCWGAGGWISTYIVTFCAISGSVVLDFFVTVSASPELSPAFSSRFLFSLSRRFRLASARFCCAFCASSSTTMNFASVQGSYLCSEPEKETYELVLGFSQCLEGLPQLIVLELHLHTCRPRQSPFL